MLLHMRWHGGSDPVRVPAAPMYPYTPCLTNCGLTQPLSIPEPTLDSHLPYDTTHVLAVLICTRVAVWLCTNAGAVPVTAGAHVCVYSGMPEATLLCAWTHTAVTAGGHGWRPRVACSGLSKAARTHNTSDALLLGSSHWRAVCAQTAQPLPA